MTISIIILCALLLTRELMHAHESRRWEIERKDLYNRIQAGSLQEYKQATTEPSAPIVKDREKLVSELAEEKGIQRADLQYPAHWKN